MMLIVVYFLVSITVGILAIRKYRESTWGKYNSNRSLKGLVFLITGANSGVGREAARQLLQRQATVVMGNRDKARTEEAIKDLRQTTKLGEIVTYDLDLSSFQSIKKFAEEVNKKHSKIDVLINNAGVAIPLEQNLRTKENFEMNFGVNHLGHFLLTNLLLSKLKESAPSRIVIVSSGLHERGAIHFDDLNLDKLRASGKKHFMNPAYCNSKLANVYHGRELAERVKDDQIDVRIVCPGFTYTGLHRNTSWCQVAKLIPFAILNMKSAWQGSQTIVYAATEKNLPGKSGDFYSNVEHYKYKVELSNEIQKKLWKKSEELTKTATKS